jgi:hypothetical protein
MKLKQQSRVCQKRKVQDQDGLSVQFFQTFKEEIMLTLLKLFHEIEREGTLPNSFYDVNITLIEKPDKDISKNRRISSQSP